MNYFIEQMVSGLPRGAIYVLIALAYTMVGGISSLINFVHGEISMSVTFTAFIVATMTFQGPTYLAWKSRRERPSSSALSCLTI